MLSINTQADSTISMFSGPDYLISRLDGMSFSIRGEAITDVCILPSIRSLLPLR